MSELMNRSLGNLLALALVLAGCGGPTSESGSSAETGSAGLEDRYGFTCRTMKVSAVRIAKVAPKLQRHFGASFDPSAIVSAFEEYADEVCDFPDRKFKDMADRPAASFDESAAWIASNLEIDVEVAKLKLEEALLHESLLYLENCNVLDAEGIYASSATNFLVGLSGEEASTECSTGDQFDHSSLPTSPGDVSGRSLEDRKEAQDGFQACVQIVGAAVIADSQCGPLADEPGSDKFAVDIVTDEDGTTTYYDDGSALWQDEAGNRMEFHADGSAEYTPAPTGDSGEDGAPIVFEYDVENEEIDYSGGDNGSYPADSPSALDSAHGNIEGKLRMVDVAEGAGHGLIVVGSLIAGGGLGLPIGLAAIGIGLTTLVVLKSVRRKLEARKNENLPGEATQCVARPSSGSTAHSYVLQTNMFGEPDSTPGIMDVIHECSCAFLGFSIGATCDDEAKDQERLSCSIDPGGPAGGIRPECIEYLTDDSDKFSDTDVCPLIQCAEDEILGINLNEDDPSKRCDCSPDDVAETALGAAQCCALIQCPSDGMCVPNGMSCGCQSAGGDGSPTSLGAGVPRPTNLLEQLRSSPRLKQRSDILQDLEIPTLSPDLPTPTELLPEGSPELAMKGWQNPLKRCVFKRVPCS